MIEPTESESKEELDLIHRRHAARSRKRLRKIRKLVLDAPHSTRVKRLDEDRRRPQARAALETNQLNRF